MSLFNLGKKKEDSKKAACACNNTNSAREATDIFNAHCNEASEGIGCIKVLGSGCKSCHALLESTKKGSGGDETSNRSRVYNRHAENNGVWRYAYAGFSCK